ARLGRENSEKRRFADVVHSESGGVDVKEVLRRDDIDGHIRISANELVIEPSGVSVVLTIAFVTDLGVAEDVGKNDFTQKLGHLGIVNLGVLDLDLNVLLGVRQELEEI